MAGTKLGGKKAAATNRQRYGLDFYPSIGRKGGKISHGGIFGVDREFAVAMGRIGGSKSPRHKDKD